MFIPNEPNEGDYLPRGVYRARYKVDGYPALVAINAQSNAIKHFKLEPYTDELLAWKRLWAFLEKHDPLPDPPPSPIRLVKDDALELMGAQAPPALPPGVHPCQREHPVTFHRRVASREFSRIHKRYE